MNLTCNQGHRGARNEDFCINYLLKFSQYVDDIWRAFERTSCDGLHIHFILSDYICMGQYLILEIFSKETKLKFACVRTFNSLKLSMIRDSIPNSAV